MDVKVYHLGEREIHMVSDSVAVVWNTRSVRRTIQDSGKSYEVTDQVRDKTKPYIDFVWIQEGADGEVWEDKDSPADGGLSIKEAQNLADGLLRAIEYMKSLP